MQCPYCGETVEIYLEPDVRRHSGAGLRGVLQSVATARERPRRRPDGRGGAVRRITGRINRYIGRGFSRYVGRGFSRAGLLLGHRVAPGPEHRNQTVWTHQVRGAHHHEAALHREAFLELRQPAPVAPPRAACSHTFARRRLSCRSGAGARSATDRRPSRPRQSSAPAPARSRRPSRVAATSPSCSCGLKALRKSICSSALSSVRTVLPAAGARLRKC